MADQRDVQQLIQSLTPSGVNNGNPNTAYNNSSTPMMDAFGNWSTPQVNPAASISFNRAAPALPAATPLNLPRLPSGVLGNTPVVGTPVLGTPSINLPEPPVQVGTGGNNPATPVVTNPGNSTGTPSIMDLISQFGGSLGTTAPSSQFGSALTGAVQPSSGAGSNIDWRQVIDAVSEPLLPGNLYLNNMDSWDTSNILAALGQKLTGIDFNSKMNFLGKLLEGQGQSNFLTDHFLDNDVNATQGMYNDMLASGEISNSPTGWLSDLASGGSQGSVYNFGNNVGSLLWGGGALSPIGGGILGSNPFGTSYSNAGSGVNTIGQTPVEQAFGLSAGSLGSSAGGAVRGSDGTMYASQADYDASVANAQAMFESMRQAQSQQRQTGGDIYGRKFEK